MTGATVVLTNVDLGRAERTLVTDKQGFYTATSLPLGNYSISVEASGFKKSVIDQIVLHVNDALTFNVALAVGSSTQEVTVQADAVQINLENATVSGLINGTQMKELVVNTRNYEQLLSLQPGVSYGGTTDQLYLGNSVPGGTTATVAFSVSGNRSSSNNWTIDGTTNVDRGSNLTLLAYPSIDAIAEFKALRNVYDASLGGSIGGQIYVITRSGTNQLHGTVYEFFRNNVLNANAYFNKLTSPIVPRPILRYNDFGGTVGGPVVIPHVYNGKDKTFFFFSGEYRRVIVAASTTLNGVPTAAERQGNFGTNVVCTSVTIVSASSATCAATGTQVTKISPTAAAYLQDVFSVDGSKVPLPNSTVDAHQLIANQNSVYNENQEIVRLDHNLKNNLQLTFRMIYDELPTVEPGGAFTGATSLPGNGTTVNQSHTNSPGHNYLGSVTWTASPTMVVQGGYDYSYGAILSNPTGYISKARSTDINPTLPYATTLGIVPVLTMSGATSLTSSGIYNVYSKDNNVFGQVTKTFKTHTFITGATYHRYYKSENATTSNAGSFGFTNAFTPAGTTAKNYQLAFANFLSGYATSFSQAGVAITPALHANLFEAFVQDNWKATPRLTLNLGLRYSYYSQPTDSNNYLDNFDPSQFAANHAPTIDTNGLICVTGSACTGGVVPNPSYDTLNGIILATPGSHGHASPYGSSIGKQHNLNFAPRVGFAYDLYGNGRTALRGGYGIGYDETLYGTYEQNSFANPPYVATASYTNVLFDNPAASTPNSAASPAPGALHGTATNFLTPYTQQYSIGVQQQISSGLLFSTDYVANHGVHLLGLVDINEAVPGAYVNAGLGIAAGGVTSSNTPRLNRIRPYAGYNAINVIENWFGSNYNSLQAQLQKRFRDNSLFDLNYTWSKALTDNQTDRSTAVQDRTNIRAEYGRSQYDRRNIFSADFVYNLPFYREQHGVTGYILGGWEITGIVAINSGLPFTPTTSSVDPGGLGFLGASSAGGRPDQVGDPAAGTGLKTRLKWFNTAAFAQVPASQPRPGNSHRGVISGPGFQRWDAGLIRNFKVTDSTAFQFRAEAFNIANHTNWATIAVAQTTPSTFGTVTAARDNRILQLALKFNY